MGLKVGRYLLAPGCYGVDKERGKRNQSRSGYSPFLHSGKFGVLFPDLLLMYIRSLSYAVPVQVISHFPY